MEYLINVDPGDETPEMTSLKWRLSRLKNSVP